MFAQINYDDDVTPFVEAIPPQAGLLPNIREYAPNIHKFTPHSRVVIPAVLSIQPSTVSDGLEADKFEDDLVEIEGIWSHVLQSNDEAPAQCPCSPFSLLQKSFWLNPKVQF